ncbi:MAG TPA: TetR/AcrR family transcriptional regulator [Candidatus Baltobacteraceae bacterium]|nr:TetR/AcrR family transcriptional regulator [Candidatus Baltobacteraceae bacterium]
MARGADRRRAELLERITDYVAENGLSDLSLRPLADAVESSPRVLLYYFTSKENLIGEVLARVRARQRTVFDALPRDAATYAVTVRAAWKLMSAPQHERIFRLFFEVYGLALQAPERYGDFLRGAVEDWIGYIAAGRISEAYPKREARAVATVLLAGYRGFLLDLLTTGDRARLDRAVDIWIAALDAVPEPETPR